MRRAADAPSTRAVDPIALLLMFACLAGVTLQAVQPINEEKLFFLRYFTCLSALICALGCLVFRRSAAGAFLYLTGVVGVFCSGLGWWLMIVADFPMVPRSVMEQASIYSLHVLVPCGALAHVLFGMIPCKLPAGASIATLLMPVAYGALTLLAQIYLSAQAPYGFLDVRVLDIAGVLELAVTFCVTWLLLTIGVVRVQMVRRRWLESGLEEISARSYGCSGVPDTDKCNLRAVSCTFPCSKRQSVLTRSGGPWPAPPGRAPERPGRSIPGGRAARRPRRSRAGRPRRAR